MAHSLLAELGDYLERNFPESDLARATSPIDHQTHIRFELGDPFPNGSDQRLEQVAARATAIMQGCFGEDDRILLLINDWAGTDPMFGNTTPEYLYELLGARLMAAAEQRQLPLPVDEEQEEPADFRQTLLAVRFGSLRWKEILAGIANYEQGREPRIGQAVYFIAPATGIIFYMYDDRGCLVFAERPSSIVHLYRLYNGWIVEYWRETIDAIFAAGG